MKETFWSKLHELWAVRRRCQGIRLHPRQNWRVRSREIALRHALARAGWEESRQQKQIEAFTASLQK
jgi:hypothetical protein